MHELLAYLPGQARCCNPFSFIRHTIFAHGLTLMDTEGILIESSVYLAGHLVEAGACLTANYTQSYV